MYRYIKTAQTAIIFVAMIALMVIANSRISPAQESSHFYQGQRSFQSPHDRTQAPYSLSAAELNRVNSLRFEDEESAAVNDSNNKDSNEDKQEAADGKEEEAKEEKKEDPVKLLGERLKKLEAALEKDADAAEQKKLDAAKKPSLKINGRIHADYWNFTDNSPGIGFFEHPDSTSADFGTDPEDRFFFRRIRLKFEGDLFETMLYRMQIDFNAPDSGEMKDMYIGFQEMPVLGTLLIGNQKRPLGLDHLNSSRFNIFIERPLVIEAFNEDARRPGITSYNHTKEEDFAWAYGFYLLENLTTDGEVIGDSMQGSFNTRLAGSPWYDEASDGRCYMHWAVSTMFAKPDGDNFAGDTNANEGRFRTRAELRSNQRWLDTGRVPGADWYETIGLESIVNLGAFQAVAEWQSNWMQRDNVTAGTGPDLHFHGGYVYLAYMLTGEHVPYDRSSGTIDRVKPFRNFFRIRTEDGCIDRGPGAWQIALRYSYLDLTDKDIAGGVENNLTGGLVWYLNPYSSVQFNAIYGDIQERAPAGGFTDGNFTALGMRFRVDF